MTEEEALHCVERNRLYGRGLGWTDVHLTSRPAWTRAVTAQAAPYAKGERREEERTRPGEEEPCSGVVPPYRKIRSGREATLLTPARLWTLEAALAREARRCGVGR